MESYSVQAVLSAVDAGFSSVFGKANSTVQTFGQKTGSALQSVGKVSTTMGLAVGAGTMAAIKSFGDFDESINKAAVIGGSSNKALAGNMKDLEKEALSLGKTLPISSEDAGNAMVEMARNGANIKDLKTEFPAISKAAAVAGEDLSNTATTVQQAMNIWGSGSKNAAKDSATLAIVANKSNATIGDMGQVFANVGSTAKTMGYSLKDVGISAGIMTNAGIPAAQASQDLNNAFTHMYKPTDSARGVMTKLGLSFTDASGNMKPLKSIITDVAKATDGMSKSEKLAALNTMFGTAGAKAMLPLMDATYKKTKKNKGSWDEFGASIDKGAKTYARANKYLSDNSSNMTKNVGQSIGQMKDAFDALIKTSIGSLAPQIKAVANALGDFATWLTTSKSPMASFTKKLIALSPIIAIALIGFGLLSTALGKLISAFSAPTKALSAFRNGTGAAGKASTASAGQIAAMGVKALGIGAGIGIAAAGLALFAMGVAKLASTGTKGLVALAAMTASIAVLAGVFALLGSRLDTALPGMIGLSATMLSAGAGALMFGAAIALAGVGVNQASQGIMTLTKAFVLLGSNAKMIVPTLTAIGVGLASMITGFVTTLVAATPQVATSFMQMLVSVGQTVLTYLPQMITLGTQIIVSFIQGITVALPQIMTATVQLIVAFLNGITVGLPQIMASAVALIVAFINGLATGLPQIITAGVTLIVNFLEGLAQGIPQVITAAVDVIVSFINGIASNLGQIIDAAVNLIGSFINGLVAAIPNIVDQGYKAVMSFVEGVGYMIGKALTSGGDLINNFVTGIINGMSRSRGGGSKNGSAVLEGIKGHVNDLISAGGDMIAGFVKGIADAASSVVKTAARVAKGAVNAVKKALGIHSPSRVFKNEVGKYIPLGMAKGIDKSAGAVNQSVSALASSAAVQIPTPTMDTRAFASQIAGANASLQNQVSSSVNGSLSVASPQADETNSLLRQLVNKNSDIVLDSGAWVGHTASSYDQVLGNNANMAKRWGR
ncbi:phage tail tape measure protein [Lactobacillus selangorensis]|nr:phage tail tape measure protein [Lactobacillus selangorensis]